jgi:hypothetical protein
VWGLVESAGSSAAVALGARSNAVLAIPLLLWLPPLIQAILGAAGALYFFCDLAIFQRAVVVPTMRERLYMRVGWCRYFALAVIPKASNYPAISFFIPHLVCICPVKNKAGLLFKLELKSVFCWNDIVAKLNALKRKS